MIDVVEQVIQRHPEVKNEGIPETNTPITISLKTCELDDMRPPKKFIRNN